MIWGYGHQFISTSPILAENMEFKLPKMLNPEDVLIVEGTVDAVFAHPVVAEMNRFAVVLEGHVPVVQGTFLFNAYWNREKIQSFMVTEYERITEVDLSTVERKDVRRYNHYIL
mmetsp:Transcript_18103/g.13145  ORF Transcript_18103/g.13145 Transcript_18103/m.13145 type:complete len:114 (-) Transcript_18103:717-1058(-)